MRVRVHDSFNLKMHFKTLKKPYKNDVFNCTISKGLVGFFPVYTLNHFCFNVGGNFSVNAIGFTSTATISSLFNQFK